MRRRLLEALSGVRGVRRATARQTAIVDTSTLDGQKQYGLTNREWFTRSYFKVRFASSEWLGKMLSVHSRAEIVALSLVTALALKECELLSFFYALRNNSFLQGLRDVSEARAMRLKMTHLAQHDFLTDLPNRLLLNDRITQAISLSRRHGCACVFNWEKD